MRRPTPGITPCRVRTNITKAHYPKGAVGFLAFGEVVKVINYGSWLNQ